MKVWKFVLFSTAVCTRFESYKQPWTCCSCQRSSVHTANVNKLQIERSWYQKMRCIIHFYGRDVQGVPIKRRHFEPQSARLKFWYFSPTINVWEAEVGQFNKLLSNLRISIQKVKFCNIHFVVNVWKPNFLWNWMNIFLNVSDFFSSYLLSQRLSLSSCTFLPFTLQFEVKHSAKKFKN